MALEAERHDQSWRKKPAPALYAPADLSDRAEVKKLRTLNAQLLAEKAQLKKATAREQRERDSIMYHAGRYAAGIRDADATQAFERMQTLLGKNND